MSKNNPQIHKDNINNSVCQITENKFRQFFSQFRNASENWEK
jgi:hypothetical protein